MELRFLGTAAGVPSLSHGTCGAVLCNGGHSLLYDVPENALQTLMTMGVPPRSMRYIVVSHLHLDHCAGLVPLLAAPTARQGGRVARLTVAGPVGTRAMVEAVLRASGSELPPEVRMVEVSEEKLAGGYVLGEEAGEGGVEGTGGEKGAPAPGGAIPAPTRPPVLTSASFPPPPCITLFPLNHRLPCIGVLYEEPDSLVFDAAAALARGVPLLGGLAALRREGRVDTPGGPVTLEECCRPRAGRRVLLCSDNEPSGPGWEPGLRFLLRRARGCDLMLHECTYHQARASKADRYVHSSMGMVAELALQLRPRRLVLSHVSNAHGSTPFCAREPALLRAGRGRVHLCSAGAAGVRELGEGALCLENAGLGMAGLAREAAGARPEGAGGELCGEGLPGGEAGSGPAPSPAPPPAPLLTPARPRTATRGPVDPLPDLSALAFADSRVLRYTSYREMALLLQGQAERRRALLAGPLPAEERARLEDEAGYLEALEFGFAVEGGGVKV